MIVKMGNSITAQDMMDRVEQSFGNDSRRIKHIMRPKED